MSGFTPELVNCTVCQCLMRAGDVEASTGMCSCCLSCSPDCDRFCKAIADVEADAVREMEMRQGFCDLAEATGTWVAP